MRALVCCKYLYTPARRNCTPHKSASKASWDLCFVLECRQRCVGRAAISCALVVDQHMNTKGGVLRHIPLDSCGCGGGLVVSVEMVWWLRWRPAPYAKRLNRRLVCLLTYLLTYLHTYLLFYCLAYLVTYFPNLLRSAKLCA